MKKNNMAKITAKLDAIASPQTLSKALARAAMVVETDAKIRCPVKDGTLRASIHTQIKDNSALVGSDLDYAPFVEFGTGLFGGTDPVYGSYASGPGRQEVPWSYKDAKGQWHTTSGQSPQPYLIPSLEENKKEIMEVLKKTIAEEVHKA